MGYAARGARRPRYTLTDAVANNAMHPDSFWIPSTEARSSLKEGSLVKLIFNYSDRQPSERMWVLVTEVVGNDEAYVGTLNNDPLARHMHFGEQIEFAPKHIIDIHGPEHERIGKVLTIAASARSCRELADELIAFHESEGTLDAESRDCFSRMGNLPNSCLDGATDYVRSVALGWIPR